MTRVARRRRTRSLLCGKSVRVEGPSTGGPRRGSERAAWGTVGQAVLGLARGDNGDPRRCRSSSWAAALAETRRKAPRPCFFENAARPGLISRRLGARLRHSRARSNGGGLPVVGSSSEVGETACGAGGVARRDVLRRDGGRVRGRIGVGRAGVPVARHRELLAPRGGCGLPRPARLRQTRGGELAVWAHRPRGPRRAVRRRHREARGGVRVPQGEAPRRADRAGRRLHARPAARRVARLVLAGRAHARRGGGVRGTLFPDQGPRRLAVARRRGRSERGGGVPHAGARRRRRSRARPAVARRVRGGRELPGARREGTGHGRRTREARRRVRDDPGPDRARRHRGGRARLRGGARPG